MGWEWGFGIVPWGMERSPYPRGLQGGFRRFQAWGILTSPDFSPKSQDFFSLNPIISPLIPGIFATIAVIFPQNPRIFGPNPRIFNLTPVISPSKSQDFCHNCWYSCHNSQVFSPKTPGNFPLNPGIFSRNPRIFPLNPRSFDLNPVVSPPKSSHFCCNSCNFVLQITGFSS